MNKKLYQQFASLIQARLNCLDRKNDEWFDRHSTAIEELVQKYMPSGSGIDSGTEIDLDKSDGNKLVFNFSYHHMNEHGFYNGWTDHQAIVIPDLAFGFNLKITGRDQNGIKEDLHNIFHFNLSKEIV